MRTVVARTSHRCIHCGEEIARGETYVKQRITPWDHEVNEYFFTYKAHIACDDFWHEVRHESEGEFWNEPDEWKRAMAARTTTEETP